MSEGEEKVLEGEKEKEEKEVVLVKIPVKLADFIKLTMFTESLDEAVSIILQKNIPTYHHFVTKIQEGKVITLEEAPTTEQKVLSFKAYGALVDLITHFSNKLGITKSELIRSAIIHYCMFLSEAYE